MYSTCLFCSASLGTNEAIEAFPVGSRVAFDAHRGRLWAVCARCGRWNLAPIEERWEAVEAAERLFADTGTRVHSENIGLARLRDGTRLIRVGKALPGEIAAWRYGGQLIKRRRRSIAIGAAVGAGAIAVAAGVPLMLSAGAPLTLLSAGFQALTHIELRREQKRIVHVLPAADSPTGEQLIVRPRHVRDAVITSSASGDLALKLDPKLALPESKQWRQGFGRFALNPTDPVVLEGDPARRVLGRIMVMRNRSGASKRGVERAIRAIEDAGGPQEVVRLAAESNALLYPTTRPRRRPANIYSFRQVAGTFRGEVLPVAGYRNPFVDPDNVEMEPAAALALEMALQDEAERRALEGELAALEAAWREAEEIARIADALPGDPPA